MDGAGVLLAGHVPAGLARLVAGTILLSRPGPRALADVAGTWSMGPARRLGTARRNVEAQVWPLQCTFGKGTNDVDTRVLTCPEWLDLECPQTIGLDKLMRSGKASDVGVPPWGIAPEAAVQPELSQIA